MRYLAFHFRQLVPGTLTKVVLLDEMIHVERIQVKKLSGLYNSLPLTDGYGNNIWTFGTVSLSQVLIHGGGRMRIFVLSSSI